eukprot:2546214-Pleurochrysis_carterae.AAC.1
MRLASSPTCFASRTTALIFVAAIRVAGAAANDGPAPSLPSSASASPHCSPPLPPHLLLSSLSQPLLPSELHLPPPSPPPLLPSLRQSPSASRRSHCAVTRTTP